MLLDESGQALLVGVEIPVFKIPILRPWDRIGLFRSQFDIAVSVGRNDASTGGVDDFVAQRRKSLLDAPQRLARRKSAHQQHGLRISHLGPLRYQV